MGLPSTLLGGVIDLLQAATEELIMGSVRKTRRGKKKYGSAARKKVKKVMHERKHGTLRSGRSKKRVKSRKQAVAIALSEARRAGAKVPKRRSKARSRKKK
jgi:hypothetical protein